MEEKNQVTKERTFGISRLITKENAKLEIELLNKLKSLSLQEKFEIAIERSNEDVGKLIVKNNIETWQDFERMINSNSVDIEKIIETCCKRKLTEETHLEFARRIRKELQGYKVSERTIIKHLAINLWPGRNDVSVLLSLNQSFDEFEAHLNQVVTNDKKQRAKKSTAKQTLYKKSDK